MHDLPTLPKPPPPDAYTGALHWSCPRCGARVGEPCRRPEGMPEGMRSIPHLARIQASQRTSGDQLRVF